MYKCLLKDNKLHVQTEKWFDKTRKNCYHTTVYDLKEWKKHGFWSDMNHEIFSIEPTFNVNESDEKWARKNYFPKVNLKQNDFKRQTI